MQQRDYTISGGKNTLSESDILRVYFDAFSSKIGDRKFNINNYKQGYSIDSLYYSFTGKERDEETGYGYFGARYLDHEILTSFLSVDRYADKYPSISPYAYCAWNPVRLIDPTGDTIVILVVRLWVQSMMQQQNPLCPNHLLTQY